MHVPSLPAPALLFALAVLVLALQVHASSHAFSMAGGVRCDKQPAAQALGCLARLPPFPSLFLSVATRGLAPFMSGARSSMPREKWGPGWIPVATYIHVSICPGFPQSPRGGDAGAACTCTAITTLTLLTPQPQPQPHPAARLRDTRASQPHRFFFQRVRTRTCRCLTSSILAETRGMGVEWPACGDKGSAGAPETRAQGPSGACMYVWHAMWQPEI